MTDIKELATLTAAEMDNIYLRNVPAIILEQYCTRFLAAYLAEQVAALRVDAERWNFVLMTEPYARNLWKSLPKSIYQDERHLNNAIDAAMGDKAGAIRGLA